MSTVRVSRRARKRADVGQAISHTFLLRPDGLVDANAAVGVAIFPAIRGKGLVATSDIPNGAVVAEMIMPFKVSPSAIVYNKNGTVCVKIVLGDEQLRILGPHDMVIHSKKHVWVDLAWKLTPRWYMFNHAPMHAADGVKEANVQLVCGTTGPLFLTKRCVNKGEELAFAYEHPSKTWSPRSVDEKYVLHRLR